MIQNYPFGGNIRTVWRDWRPFTIHSLGKNSIPDPDSVCSLEEASRLESFDVSPNCMGDWLTDDEGVPVEGDVCICGHPMARHPDSGLCLMGVDVCGCAKAEVALMASDLRCFYQQTFGPAQAHALSKGLATLLSLSLGYYEVVARRCQNFGTCGSTGNVWPVRLRTAGRVSLGVAIREKHGYICEQCLHFKLSARV